MHLVTFSENNRVRIGVVDGAEVVDLAQAAPSLPQTLQAFIGLGTAGLTEARRAAASGKARLPLARVKLLAPIPRPARNILCVGKNYHDHVREMQTSLPAAGAPVTSTGVPQLPIIFTKWTSSVIGPKDSILSGLDHTKTTDYEGELGVIIGPGGRGIARQDAMRHVYGYTIVNDVTARALQRLHEQWFLGKSPDSFCPMGPAIVTADEVPEVGKLQVQTRVNGELRQNAPVSDLIFDIPTLIETISRTMTLEAGDIIATGTPSGVGMGFKPPKFLKTGDVVTVTIEPIGSLENPVT